MTEQTNFISVPAEFLRDFAARAFRAVGVPDDDAAVCADVLVRADRRGMDSHGIGRLKSIYLDRIRDGVQRPVTRFEVLRETPATAVVDGHDGMGQVISVRAMRLAMDKARQCGLGMVAVRNSSHYGIAGYYAMMAAERDMIGVNGTNARPSVAPTNGVDNLLGTNPLCFGIPTDEPFPFVLDCATSVGQRGKIERCLRLGLPVPKGWVIDRGGGPVTDPREALRGFADETAAMTPLGGAEESTGGHKGYGYATVVEILSSALQGGPFLRALSGLSADGEKQPHHLGHFFLAMDVSAFTEPAAFKAAVGDLLRTLRASQTARGHARIYTAGEKEYESERERGQNGVPLSARVRGDLASVRRDCGVDVVFPWEQA